MSEPDLTDIQRDAIYAMGLFILNWGMVEGTMEMAIAQELGLDAANGSILTAGMQSKPKSMLLRGLLERNPDANKAKIDLVKLIQQQSTRNDIAHGVPGINAWGLIFYRRTNDGEFKSRLKKLSDNEMLMAAIQVGNIASDLQDLFGITDDIYEAFFQEAHKAANKS